MHRELREAVIRAACRLHSDKLTVANSGNISVRCDGGMLITPSGIAYESLVPAQIVHLDLDGRLLQGDCRPSSEWRIHADVYRARPAVGAVVHAHSPAATALSATRQPLPPFHYMVALFGGDDVPCADYAVFGSQALSDHVLAALQQRSACLMANHGLLATGADLALAFARALELESLCQQYLLARSLGDIVLLDHDQMAEARSAFAGYGQHSS
ncbi:MAG TPA: class II aldolase/adducin family protein [Pseudomonadales bacterium]